MVAPDVSSPLAVQEFTSSKTKDTQMTDANLSLAATPAYEGNNRLILGIVLAVVTFWLFAQTTLNVAPTTRDDLHLTNSESNIAVSITALFSGIFIVVVGGLADQFDANISRPYGREAPERTDRSSARKADQERGGGRAEKGVAGDSR